MSAFRTWPSEALQATFNEGPGQKRRYTLLCKKESQLGTAAAVAMSIPGYADASGCEFDAQFFCHKFKSSLDMLHGKSDVGTPTRELRKGFCEEATSVNRCLRGERG
jgi:hypothetical protein